MVDCHEIRSRTTPSLYIGIEGTGPGPDVIRCALGERRPPGMWLHDRLCCHVLLARAALGELTMSSGLRLETTFHDLGEGLAILRRLSFRVHIWGPGLAWYGSTMLRTHHFVRTTSVSRRSGPFSQRIRTCSLFDPAGCASAKSYDVHSRPETQSLVHFRLQSRLQQPIAIR